MTNALYYPRPLAADFELARAIHEMQEDDDLFGQFLAERRPFLDRYPIADEAKDLLSNLDYAGLVARGIHPMLVVQMQRRVEWGMKLNQMKDN